MKKLYLILAIFLLSCTPEVDKGSPFHLIEGTYEPPYKPPPVVVPPVNIVKGSLYDNRDDKVYETVETGDHTWMAENLNYNANGSVCYDNSIYGSLYNWETAMSACPDGWHLPSYAEWEDLVQAAGGENVAGRYLKATKDWNEKGNGLDTYGFNALPGGDSHSCDRFIAVGYIGIWWSSDEQYSGYPYCMEMNSSRNDAIFFNSAKDRLHSVRCVQDLLMSQDDE